MAASDFKWTPSVVTPRTPVMRDLKTEFESGPPEYALLDDQPQDVFYELLFKIVDSSGAPSNHPQVLEMQNHFRDRGGRVRQFWWTSVPAWINGGVDMLVHYESMGDPAPHSWRYFTMRVVLRRA